jgi:hypothetical protein
MHQIPGHVTLICERYYNLGFRFRMSDFDRFVRVFCILLEVRNTQFSHLRSPVATVN